MDQANLNPSPGLTDEASSTESTGIDSGIVHSHGASLYDSAIKNEADKDRHSHGEEIDVVGLDSESDEAIAASSDVIRRTVPRTRDSGVGLNETVSPPIVNACASPLRWSLPQYASSPKMVWRPWYGPDGMLTPDHGHGLSSQQQSNYPVQYHPSYFLAQQEMLLRLSHQFPGVGSYYPGMTPMGSAAPVHYLHGAYPTMPPAAAAYFGPYAPSFPQYQVPQVPTSSADHSRFFKRSLSPLEHSATNPAKRLYLSPPDSIQSLIARQPNTSQPEQSVAGLVLAAPPPDALPPRVSLRGKRKAIKEETQKAATDNSKKREKPPPYGDHELHEVTIHFQDTPLKHKYCDSTGAYKVPKLPESPEEKEQLRMELLELFHRSNLPRVPIDLHMNIDALILFPNMHHLLSLYIDGVDLDSLHFGAYGQAFCNPRLAAMPEEKLNAFLDDMSYVGADSMLHCRVVKTNSNGMVCDHVAKELGKMRRHAKNHYPDKKWVCCFCRAQMPDMTDMERHTSTHSVLKPFKCPECFKVFSQKVTLNQHMKNIHDMKPETVDPRKSLVCRQHGVQFLEHEREACLSHLELHHDRTEDFKNRKKRGQFPYDV
ncbi:transcriptional regulator ovo [Biomphalaria pfeifferi]|uniref:Transcriptional regulator ovo n=1 Tax=Biomphalaria pfeifferi TaxID=112525 RepID=A0AAD8AT16_BIOPF|nr:transcriptional regulator ovo [Biomphalaria pfeifferi]